MSFESIAGQDRSVGTLRSALRSGRVSHAYIFAGHRGVGKMTTAVELARALVCRQQSDDACGNCAACRKVDHRAHPDVHRVGPEGLGRLIKTEVIRERVIKELGLKPYEAPHKVVLIDDAHAMTLNAANCLLKTLEEPPPASVLVLVTPRPDGLPETVLSRCHMVRFAVLGPQVIREKLEAAGTDPGAAQFLARACGGSLGRALKMAKDTRLPEVRRGLLGTLMGLTTSNVVESASKFVAMARALATSRAKSEPGIDVRAESRSTAEWLLDLAVLFYRDVAVRQLGVDDARLSNADVIQLVDDETRIRAGQIRGILDTIEEAKSRLRSNVDIEATALDAFAAIAVYRAQRPAKRPLVTAPRRNG